MKPGRVFLGAVLAALLSLMVYLIGNTRLDVRDSGPGGSLSVATRLPNATCHKTLTTEFPFVRLECQTVPNPGGTGSRPSAQP